jgi:hypothetical protein
MYRTAGATLALASIMLVSVPSAMADQPPFGTPEIDPGSMGSALALLIGGAMMISGRSRKA